MGVFSSCNVVLWFLSPQKVVARLLWQRIAALQAARSAWLSDSDDNRNIGDTGHAEDAAVTLSLLGIA